MSINMSEPILDDRCQNYFNKIIAINPLRLIVRGDHAHMEEYPMKSHMEEIVKSVFGMVFDETLDDDLEPLLYPSKPPNDQMTNGVLREIINKYMQVAIQKRNWDVVILMTRHLSLQMKMNDVSWLSDYVYNLLFQYVSCNDCVKMGAQKKDMCHHVIFVQNL